MQKEKRSTASGNQPKTFRQTPSQTIGPFFAHGLTPRQFGYHFTGIAESIIASTSVKGLQITLTGKVYDGEGREVTDALLEFWQCDAKGKYASTAQDPQTPEFQGFGRVGTDPFGHYEIKTIKPGSTKRGEAPFINVIVLMRGMLNHQYTRIYFSDEQAKNEKDPILNLVPKSRRKTLLAKRKEKNGLVIYHFDIHMQGRKETVFFDL